MPAPVKRIKWRCSWCGKQRWLKPHQTTGRKFCSRQCLYQSQEVVRPAGPKEKKTYGERECVQCKKVYIATSAHQRYCSQACVSADPRRRWKNEPVVPRPCEACGKPFTPRRRGVGRFCSRACTFAGQRGPKAGHWNGGRHIGYGGYVRVYKPDHPSATGKGGYVLEHRLVMEQRLGRRLARGETVHHLNGDRSDNRDENLELRSGPHGKGAALMCGDCWSRHLVPIVTAGG